jgi:hypothetical protein
MSEQTPEPPTYTWTADRGAAWSAAYALTRLELAAPRSWVFAVVALVGLPTFLARAGQGSTASLLLFGVLLAAFLIGSSLLIAFWSRIRHFRRSLPAGLVLTSQFFPDHMVVRRQWTASAVQFRGYNRLDVVAGWVFLRQREGRVRVLYPQSLIPSDDLARIRLTIVGLVPEDDQ